MAAPSTQGREKRRDAQRQEDPLRSKERGKGHGRAASPGSLLLARSSDTTGPPPADQHLSLLDHYEQPGYGAQRAALMTSLQQSYGNQYVQRLLDPAPDPGAQGPRQPAPASAGGRPLDPPDRGEMEDRFKTSFGGVRVHTNSDADEASRALGARAFTTGQDIFFRGGSYRPGTAEGKHLLAHELTHTIQQRSLPVGAQPALEVVPPHDPSEQHAERVAEAVVRGEHAGPIAPLQRTASAMPALMIQRLPAGAPPLPATPKAAPAGPAPGVEESGDFILGLGGLRIKRADLDREKGKGKLIKDLSALSLPGLKLKNLTLDLDKTSGAVKKGRVEATADVPFVKPLSAKDLQIDIDKDGKAALSAKARLDIAALNNPQVELTLKEGTISAEATITAEKIKPAGLPKLKIPQASVTIGIAEGRLTGSGQVSLEYQDLAKGDFSVEFKDGAPAGKGRVELLPDYLKGTEATLGISEGKLSGEVTVPATKLKPPVPGLTITEGTLSLGMENSELQGKGDGIAFSYRGLGTGTVSFLIAKDHLTGSGALALQIPGLSPVQGSLRYAGGKLSGDATITPDKFPKGLPIKGGSITVAVDEQAQISGKGNVKVDLFGVGKGDLKLGYEQGVLDLGAEVELTRIPGLESGRVLIGLKDGKLEGEGEIGVAPKQIPGLAGTLLVVYRDDRFSGKARLGYAKDKFSGEIELLLNQNEKGNLGISGSGEVTARLTDWLTGKVHVEVLPDATTRIAGQLKADDIELFPEKKADRELFNFSQNIPLWAILVAVIRLRGGVRAGVGPGKLRDVTAEGEFSTVPGEDPKFKIHGELFIPAYAEAYVAFGAGLGLDVVIGSLTGGIEAIGTAGIYGAISVVPEIAYEGGNYAISGTATMAAGAKLKLGLQAWAEVEALWITVWSNEWKLAEWVWDVGPELALQAQMRYVFGKPEPPTLDFKTSDIDSKKLIQDAMPKDGPKGSGGREALKNQAEWKGKLKEQKKDASKIPPAIADKQAKAPKPKAAPPKPPKKSPPPGAKAKDPKKAKEDAAKDLKDKAAPDKAKPTDKAHQEKWDKGMAALERLVEKSQKDPLDEEQIYTGLDDLKKTYGFSTLSHELDGNSWLIDAAMSPGVKKRASKRKPKRPEGDVDTFSGLQGPTGDRMTPDHEPQHSLMEYVAKELKYDDDILFDGTSLDKYTRDDGICLNMHEIRHRKTRSYGKSKAAAVAPIVDKRNAIPKGTSKKKARKLIGKAVIHEFEEDQKKVKGPEIYGGPLGSKLSKGTRDNVDKGVKKVGTENRKNYFKAFDK